MGDSRLKIGGRRLFPTLAGLFRLSVAQYCFKSICIIAPKGTTWKILIRKLIAMARGGTHPEMIDPASPHAYTAVGSSLHRQSAAFRMRSSILIDAPIRETGKNPTISTSYSFNTVDARILKVDFHYYHRCSLSTCMPTIQWVVRPKQISRPCQTITDTREFR